MKYVFKITDNIRFSSACVCCVVPVIGNVGFTILHIRGEQHNDVSSPPPGAYVFILLCNSICSFILHDQQKSITLDVLNLKFKPAPGISFGLSLNRATNFYDGIYRNRACKVFIR